MNAQVAPKSEVLPPVDSPVAEYNATAAGLSELRTQIMGRTYDCTTAEGDKLAREDRRLCVRLRVAIKEKHAELKQPVLEQGRLLDTEKNRITAIIEELEARPDAAIKAQEAIDEAKRAERQRLEAERQAKVDKEIGRIANLPVAYVGATAAVLRGVIASLEANTFEAMEGISLIRANEAKGTALESLQSLLESRIAADAEREENERQRAENERILAEQREQQRIDNERAAAERAEADRVAAAERERLQREDDERRAEQRRKDQEEADLREAERADQQRIEDEARAEQLRKDEEARQELRRQQDEIAAKERAAQAKREQDAIDKATLIEAAFDARELLTTLGYGEHLITRKLDAALRRAEPVTLEIPEALRHDTDKQESKLTKSADVLKVLQAGGYAVVGVRSVGYGMAHLFDKQNRQIDAWQNAIAASLTKCEAVTDEYSDNELGTVRRWEIKASKPAAKAAKAVRS